MKLRRRELIFLFILSASSCSAISDFVENKKGGRKFATTNPIFDKYIARFEQLGKSYTKDPYFHIGDIPINFGDTENPLFDGVCFTYSNGEKEIIIKKSWWDEYEKKDTVEGDEKQDAEEEEEEEKEHYSLIQESLIFHELGHCHLNRKHENGPLSTQIPIKRSMMSHNIVSENDYRKYKEGYWEELFTESTETLAKEASKNN